MTDTTDCTLKLLVESRSVFVLCINILNESNAYDTLAKIASYSIIPWKIIIRIRD